VRDLRPDELVAGYKAAAEEQEELVKELQQQRQDYRLDWAKLEAYRAECPEMAADPEIQRKVEEVVAKLEELEAKLNFHQRLAMALGRRANGMENDWAQPVGATRFAARRVI
jgi:DNA repair exonuclease SbcCD ATPase subunit